MICQEGFSWDDSSLSIPQQQGQHRGRWYAQIQSPSHLCSHPTHTCRPRSAAKLRLLTLKSYLNNLPCSQPFNHTSHGGRKLSTSHYSSQDNRRLQQMGHQRYSRTPYRKLHTSSLPHSSTASSSQQHRIPSILRRVGASFQTPSLEILDTVEDIIHHKIAFHGKNDGETITRPYANEHMIIMQMR